MTRKKLRIVSLAAISCIISACNSEFYFRLGAGGGVALEKLKHPISGMLLDPVAGIKFETSFGWLWNEHLGIELQNAFMMLLAVDKHKHIHETTIVSQFLRYNILTGAIRPFLLAGASWAWGGLDPDIGIDGTGLHGGIGCDFRISETLRLDLRLIYHATTHLSYEIDDPSNPEERLHFTLEKSERIMFKRLSLQAGISAHF